MALVPFPSQNRSDDEQNLPAKPGGFSPFGDDEEPAGEGRMTFLEHLDELRKRLVKSVIIIVAAFLFCFWMSAEALSSLGRSPAPASLSSGARRRPR